jgi:hypothetical protein
MRSPGNLNEWTRQLLPAASVCGQHAAAALLRALLVGFTTHLAQLARQLDRDATAKSGRQFLARWLDRPDWEPEQIYAHLNRVTRRVLARSGDVLLLVDFTDLGTQWKVLQVSIPWQGRALPVYRTVARYQGPDVGQPEQIRAACTWLQEHLPGPAERYVLVLDRGFPSHLRIREWIETEWRFVVRVTGEWKVTHPEYTGQLKELPAGPGGVGPVPRCFREAVLGTRGKGRAYWSQAHVVVYQADGAKEPWLLVTSEREGARAVAIYRERMRIECEFRDLKGPWGLDQLAAWQDGNRGARFLALVAVYEWRLAHLWLCHRLQQWGARLVVKGRLSWIRITREWIQHRLRRKAKAALASL